MTSNRNARVSEELKRVISDIIKNEIRDPRLPELLSIVRVDVSSDFAYAKVYYSVLNGQGSEKEIRSALKGAAGFIRRELASRVNLRQTPELRFEHDQSIERVIALNKLIDETVKSDAMKGK
ncbi:MAG: 30S ribosome-binding factor RbfA [Oscillospiraceae bacterium]|nr:30S ribosome-binding factor RbfA [Oscillospiraceae bacterium]